MDNTARIRKLLSALIEYENDCGYYDDEKEKSVIEGTEEDCYNSVMEDDELHLLTEEKVRAFIHMMFADPKSFSLVCLEFKAF